MNSLKSLLLCVLLIAVPASSTTKLSCKDDNNKDVDWWIMVKSPQEVATNSKTAGTAFGYIDANSPSEFSWSKSSSVNKDSPLSYTIDAINSAKASLSVYNDSVPGDQEYFDNAHMKGFLAVDDTQAAYVMHSFPAYPLMNSDGSINPEVQYGQLMYGQHAFCSTLSADDADDLAKNLAISNPKVYYGNLPKALEASLPNVAALHAQAERSFFVGAQTVRSYTDKDMIKISTVGGEKLTAVAHNKYLNTDYFENVLSPYMDAGFLVESWGRPWMATYCKGYAEENISEIKHTDDDYFTWDSYNDHSKWAASTEGNLVCINDNNRMTSQRSRGGGSTCFDNSDVHKAFSSAISKFDGCDTVESDNNPFEALLGFLGIR